MNAVVWGSWWIVGSKMESFGVGLQLYLPPIWCCYTAYSLCKVCSLFHVYTYIIKLMSNWNWLLFDQVIYLCDYSNIYYISDHFDKRTWTYIFGACCATTVFIPSFHNYRIWSFLGLGMTTYTAWYMTIASLIHGQVNVLRLVYTCSFCITFKLHRVSFISNWFAGWGSNSHRAKEAGALSHWSNQHTLYFWWTCGNSVS